MESVKEATISFKESGKDEFDALALDGGCINESRLQHPWWYNFKYLISGVMFGIILVKGEVISWVRIQEMFRFQSFHMYGIIGSAILVAMISLWIIRKFDIKTVHGEKIELTAKKFDKGNVYGGLLFGFGWAMTGACPGPLFAQVGTGALIVVVSLVSAIAGTWLYGALREKLPH